MNVKTSLSVMLVRALVFSLTVHLGWCAFSNKACSTLLPSDDGSGDLCVVLTLQQCNVVDAIITFQDIQTDPINLDATQETCFNPFTTLPECTMCVVYDHLDVDDSFAHVDAHVEFSECVVEQPVELPEIAVGVDCREISSESQCLEESETCGWCGAPFDGRCFSKDRESGLPHCEVCEDDEWVTQPRSLGPQNNESGSSGLTNDQKMGLAVGIPLAFLVVCLGCVMYRRKKNLGVGGSIVLDDSAEIGPQPIASAVVPTVGAGPVGGSAPQGTPDGHYTLEESP